jgi:prepilin-type N-terminal cleavage/methylation domain-containing protein
MSNKLTKKGFRGFTLIELLVVIAIIGLLSTVIAAPIQNARKKARDAKKVAELKAVELALEQYAEAQGEYPVDLNTLLVGGYMPVLPTYATINANVRDRYAYVVYTATAAGGSPQRFGYHLGAHLEVFGPALDTDRDCQNVTINAVQIGAGNCAYYNTTTAATYSYPGWVSGMIGTSVTADFNGADVGTTTCTAVTDCIFDITSQQ